MDASCFKKRSLPYKKIPTIKIGRLARDIKKTSSGFGGVILRNALSTSLELSESKLGVWGVEVDLINEKVKSFYNTYGFHEIPGSPLSMFLPMTTLKTAALLPIEA